MAFIDAHKGEFGGVQPICQVLSDAGLPVAPSTYYAARDRSPSRRATRDADLSEKIMKVYQENYQVYGARKIWRQLLRDGVTVARCTVERLMRAGGIEGARRGKKVRTTVADPKLP